MAVVRGLLLRPVDRAFGAVDVESHVPRGGARRGMLNEVRVQASESLVVSVFGEDIRFEPVERRGERHAGLSPLARGEHPKRRVLGEPLRVVGVLVPGQAAIDRLPKQVGQRELAVASGAGIGEVSLDQRTHAEALVQFAWKQEARIGRDRGAAELDAKLRVEREANRARCRVTHWMMPSAPARHPRNPHFLRALSDYGPVRSSLKTKMRV
jgi:hypothetical protein